MWAPLQVGAALAYAEEFHGVAQIGAVHGRGEGPRARSSGS